MTYDFWIPGEPIAQGSKNAYVRGGKAVMVETNKKLPAWRAAIVNEVNLAHHPIIEGPVVVYSRFYFARPKSHYTARDTIKDLAPKFKASKPDLDKLCRAVGDALTDTLLKDDSQIVRWIAMKQYTPEGINPPEGLVLTVYSA